MFANRHFFVFQTWPAITFRVSSPKSSWTHQLGGLCMGPKNLFGLTNSVGCSFWNHQLGGLFRVPRPKSIWTHQLGGLFMGWCAGIVLRLLAQTLLTFADCILIIINFCVIPLRHTRRGSVNCQRCRGTSRTRKCPPLGPSLGPRHRSPVGSCGEAVSYERGAPVSSRGFWNILCITTCF